MSTAGTWGCEMCPLFGLTFETKNPGKWLSHMREIHNYYGGSLQSAPEAVLVAPRGDQL